MMRILIKEVHNGINKYKQLVEEQNNLFKEMVESGTVIKAKVTMRRQVSNGRNTKRLALDQKLQKLMKSSDEAEELA